MRTLVELYDAEQILNLISATQLECDLVVFLYTADQKHLIHNAVIESLITAPTEYMEYSPASLESLLDQIEGDEIFIDVHGGDDLAISIVSAERRETDTISAIRACQPISSTFFMTAQPPCRN